MDFIMNIAKKEITKKIFSFLVLVLIFYVLRSFFDLIIITFLLTYLIYSLQTAISKRLRKYIKIKDLIITLVLYITLVLLIILFMYKYVPVIINQAKSIYGIILKFNPETDTMGLNKYTSFIGDIDIKAYMEQGANVLIKYAANFGKFSFNIFVAFILSIFFMLEKEKIKKFMNKFEHSRVNGIYKYFKYFGGNFLNSFGKVIQAQILIALTNSILSTIALGFMRFPQLLVLGVMIFIFSLIPVAGTIISLIPLSIIAFNIGGFMKVIDVIIMIILLHGLESYVLNPKFMSVKTDLPVFFVFVILLVGEHFMGVWGLLLGVPLFIFILDLFEVGSYNK